jgi:hypothetical protein
MKGGSATPLAGLGVAEPPPWPLGVVRPLPQGQRAKKKKKKKSLEGLTLGGGSIRTCNFLHVP